MKALNDKLEKDKNSSIEIIGLFAAIMGLIIININIIKSAKTYLESISLIIGLTFAMSFFASLIHIFFSLKANYIPLFISLAGLVFLLGIGLYKDIHLNRKE